MGIQQEYQRFTTSLADVVSREFNHYQPRAGGPTANDMAPCIVQRSFPGSWARRWAKSPAASDGDSSGQSWRTATKRPIDLPLRCKMN